MSSAPAPGKSAAPPPPPSGNGGGNTRRHNGASHPTATGYAWKATTTTASRTGECVVLYGPGGVGKTELAANIGQVLEKPPAIIDLEDGARRVRGPSGQPLNVARFGDPSAQGGFTPIQRWEMLLDLLRAPVWSEYGAVILDSLTKAQEMVTPFVLDTIPHEKGKPVNRIEDYGYGKGYYHIYDVFCLLLQELDRHRREGRHVIAIAHECTSNVANPAGDDFLRFEPRLQMMGKDLGASIRHKVKEWADHLLFIGYDITVAEGKAQGAGTRTIYPIELPFCMAKSRHLQEQIGYAQGDASLWQTLLA